MTRIRVFAAVAAVSAIVLAVSAGEVKTDLPGTGSDKQLLQKDDPVTAGSFDGTWMYVNRDSHFALWIRSKDGVPQARIKYQSLASPEAFETDWDGKAIYYMASRPVTFELKLGESTADKLTGKWEWVLTSGNAMRRETADVVIYRTVYGRTLLMDFQNYEKTIVTGGKNHVMRAPVAWNWMKISNRELLWDELPLLTRRLAERAGLSIGVAAFFLAGYFGVGRNLDPERARDLGTALDDRIPFVASTVWVYLWVFPASLLPLFVVRSPRLFRRTILAYAAAIAASLTLFVVLPVTSTRLRVDPTALDVNRASPWVVATLYRIDPPVNLFPSLHLSIAILAALSALTARRFYGVCAFAGVALVAVSVCTVKQHFVADGVAGAALAALLYVLFLRGFQPEPGIDPAFSWHGPAAYFALLVAAYSGLYAWFVIAR